MKSIEEELAPPFAGLDKALERVAKTYAKFIHSMSHEQRAAVFEQMEARLEATKADMLRAGQKAQPFSFTAAPRVSSVAPRGQEVPRPLHPIHTIGHGESLTPARPIGRLARDAQEPDAGGIVVGQPIVSPLVRLGHEERQDGVGYLEELPSIPKA